MNQSPPQILTGALREQTLRNELAQIKAAIPSVMSYQDREFREIPKKLQDDLRQIPWITKPTPSGLEKMQSILMQLWVAQLACEKLLANQPIDDLLAFLDGKQLSLPDGLPAKPTATAAIPDKPVSAASTLVIPSDASSNTSVAAPMPASISSAATFTIPPTEAA